MKRTIPIVLFLLGIGCIAYVFLWLNAEITSLLEHYENLTTLGLFEESKQYRIEAIALSKWVVPLTVLGLLLLVPFIRSLIIKGRHLHDEKK